MINYEEEAQDFHKQVNMRLSMTDEQWLRQHDARLLREMAADLNSWQVHGNTFCGHISYIERRAREIESEIGEKP